MRNASFTIRHSICGLLALSRARTQKHYSHRFENADLFVQQTISITHEAFACVLSFYANICDAMNNGGRKLLRRSTHTCRYRAWLAQSSPAKDAACVCLRLRLCDSHRISRNKPINANRLGGGAVDEGVENNAFTSLFIRQDRNK